MKKLLILLSFLIIVLVIGQKVNLLPQIQLDKYLSLPKIAPAPATDENRTVLYEESVITKVVENALPSVVTVGISTTSQSRGFIEIDPFNPFSPFRQVPGSKKKVEQNIGSGFIISQDGLVITNKHVVSETNASYNVLTNDNKKYYVEKIYRDPLNDIAILKINAGKLKPLKLGNSSSLKLGQLVIAIGTPLGEFTNTVTNGIVSGLGRGITAGSPLEGYVEKLDNVVQTNAAISPGNSGGPLLNSKGEVIGINTAIAAGGQNIGFAIPSDIIKELIDNFNKQGATFERPYIGVRYEMIDLQNALRNAVVEGAYVVEVLEGSPAEKAGIQEEDIISEVNSKKVKGDDNQSIAQLIAQKKIGDKIQLKVWRNGEFKTFQIALEASP
ncbi:MAG: trypsin-like peptidase domain-containing protein [Candidatus Roizmanbacteria bacterium]|nr:MAG: trypsin-like peptidase domain-containing protein [Candidatus Roizmanbacteria bacterium]